MRAEKAVELARHLGMATIGVGKGGVVSVMGDREKSSPIIERTAEHRILQYEGGHKRIIHYNPTLCITTIFPWRRRRT